MRTDPPGAEKERIRRSVREALFRISREARDAAGLAVRDRLLALPEFRLARTVFTYLALRDEVPTMPFARAVLEAGKRLALGRVQTSPPTIDAVLAEGPLADPERLEETLVRGPFGIPEPPEGRVLAPAAIDLAIVPGRAFAPNGSRLGRGGGYFDRFLPLLRKDAVLAGVAFDEQIVAALPREIHDAPVRLVVTPTRILGPTAGPA